MFTGKYIKLQQQYERTQNYILNKENNYKDLFNKKIFN